MATSISTTVEFLSKITHFLRNSICFQLGLLCHPACSLHELCSLIGFASHNAFHSSILLLQEQVFFLQLSSILLNCVIIERGASHSISLLESSMVLHSLSTGRTVSRLRRYLFLQPSNFNTVLISNTSNFTQVRILHDRVSLSKEIINQHSELVSRTSASCFNSKLVNA